MAGFSPSVACGRQLPRRGSQGPLAPSARGLPPQRVGERTLRQSEIFRAMAKFSSSGPAGPPLPFWRKRHLPRVGGVCLAEGGKETERNTL